MGTAGKNGRNPALELLRVISLFGVIVMHVTSWSVGDGTVTGSAFMINLIYNALFHYGVPIFVMISGVLFLQPDKLISIKKLWTHNILRMIIVYLVWSTAYGINDYLQYKAGWKFIVWEVVNSRDHLWFLPMLVGLYMIVPILSTWLKNAKDSEVRYFLCLFVVFQLICETVKAIPHPEIVDFVLALRNIQLVCSYVGYFVLGYHLIYIGISEKNIKWIYIIGVACGVLSLISLVGFSRLANRGAFEIVDSFSLLTFGWTTGIFVAVNRLFDKSACLRNVKKQENVPTGGKRISKLMAELGQDSFGAYLCHIWVIELLIKFGFTIETIPLVAGIPIYVLIVFVNSMVVGGLLRRIPYIGRYIC